MPLNLQIQLDGDVNALRVGLEAWLATLPAFSGGTPRLPELGYVSGSGSANVTLTGRLAFARDGVDAGEDIVVRLPAADLTPYLDKRLERQATAIRWVADHGAVPVPQVIGADDSGAVLGRPFMMMRRIEGAAPIDFPGYNITGFLVDLTEEERRRLWTSGLDTLIRLHNAPSPPVDLLDFPGLPDAGPVSLLAHWRNSLDWAADDLDHGYFADVHRWLSDKLPADAPQGLSWGDARVGNMLFRDLQCVAVLDWEMASCAGPLIDLAWWLLFDRIQDEDSGVPRLPGLGNRAETIARWEAGTGLSAARIGWYDALAAFELGITRSRAFGHRRRQGLPVPSQEDPRSVVRLQRRIDAAIASH